jgi:hypothetical protein
VATAVPYITCWAQKRTTSCDIRINAQIAYSDHVLFEPGKKVEIKRQYIVDEQNKKVAVQLDIDTFERIEEILEDRALYQIMSEDNDEEPIDREEAIRIYRDLRK